MTTKTIPQPTRPHPQYPHFQLVYDLPSPLSPILNPMDAAEYFRSIWPPSIDVEVSLSVLMLNSLNQVIAHHTVNLGNPDYQLTAIGHYRMISWITAQSCANSIYIAHNVPGEFYLGDQHIHQLHFSEALHRIGNAMLALDIQLNDHLLITPVDFLSIKTAMGADWYITGTKEGTNNE